MRAFLVDDEPLALDLLRDLLARHGDIEVVGQAGDGRAALEALAKIQVDVLFLDIRMPEGSGFDVLRALGEEAPQVIFVTAFDRYAVQAFEVAAVDYLLKPYDQQRLDLAVDRVRERLQATGGSGPRWSELESALERLESQGKEPRRLYFKSGGRLVGVEPRRLIWLEAQGKKTRVHAAGRTLEVRESLKHWEGTLDPERFVRISRSAIVHVDRIAEVQPWFHGELVLILDDGSRVPTTRAYRSRLPSHLRS